MPYIPAVHNRHSIRLPGYDYTEPGAYFLTILTHKKENLFGRVIKGVVQLSPIGEIVQEQWEKLPSHFSNVLLDAYVIMPNHIHGILVITERTARKDKAFEKHSNPNVFRSNAMPIPSRAGSNALPSKVGSQPGSVPAMVQNFKSITSRMINKHRNTPGATIWHRNYYEHIIRDEEDYCRIQEYILENPRKWESMLAR